MLYKWVPNHYVTDGKTYSEPLHDVQRLNLFDMQIKLIFFFLPNKRLFYFKAKLRTLFLNLHFFFFFFVVMRNFIYGVTFIFFWQNKQI